MSYKVVLVALGVALAAVFGTWGASAALHSGDRDPSVSESPTLGLSLAPSPSQSPAPSALVSESPSPTPSPTAGEQLVVAAPAPAAPKAPAPPAHPANSGFGEMYVNIAPAPPFTVGTRTVALQGEIRLAVGASVACAIDMGGSSWVTGSDYIGAEWVGDFHVFMTSADVSLAPADYPFSVTCTTSDGASWSGSGFADAARWTGITA
jgi:hypothetical protein